MAENTEFAPTVNTNEVQAQPQMKKSFCKYCGTELQPGTSFCPSCGKPQGNAPVQQNVAQAPQQTQQAFQQPVQQPAYAAGVYQQPVANSSQTTSTTVIVEGGRSNGLGTAGFVFVCWHSLFAGFLW